MKQTFLTLLLLSGKLLLFGQHNQQTTLLQSSNKFNLYYAELTPSAAHVFQMGSHFDKAGTGYAILDSDTLIKQEDGSYHGKNREIIREENKLYLVSGSRKKKKFLLGEVSSLSAANNNLNNGYYLDQYFAMANDLNKIYPLGHHSFRGGFYSWKQLFNKDMDHREFRIFADQKIKEIRDSVARANDRYTASMNYLLKNMSTLDYNVLKDSIGNLHAEYRVVSAYYGEVVKAVSREQPEYFFRLAEDFPENRRLIFFQADESKEAGKRLKAVEGHDQVKKEFFKDRRFGKTMLLKTVLIYTGVAAVLTVLIASQ